MEKNFIIELRNSTLTNSKGFQSPAADLSIEVNRSDIEAIMVGRTTLIALAGEGKAKLSGDTTILQTLKDVLVEFTADFDIMPGTTSAKKAAPANQELFEHPEPSSSAGG